MIVAGARLLALARALMAGARRIPPAAWLALGACLLLFVVWHAGRDDGRREVEREIQRAQAAADQRTADVLIQGAGERADDRIATARLERELTDAASSPPDRPVSPAGLRLACERLRHDGVDLAQVPECRGPPDRAQAAP